MHQRPHRPQRLPQGLHLHVAAGLLVALAGCGGGGGADAGPGGDGAAGSAGGNITVLDHGGLAPALVPGSAVVAAFPESAVDWYVETAQAGDCRLLEYQPGFCAEPCDGVCVDPGVCEPWPSWASAGTLTVTGLQAALALDPGFDGRYTTSGGLPDPLFDPDATVAVSAAGDRLPAFSLSALGPPPLALAFADGTTVELLDGADFTLSWTGPVADSRVRIGVSAGGQFHGIPTPSWLVCDAADSGTLVIPRAIVEALPSLGIGCLKMHDCSYFSVMRYRRATATVDGREIELLVGSGRDHPVTHP